MKDCFRNSIIQAKWIYDYEFGIFYQRGSFSSNWLVRQNANLECKDIIFASIIVDSERTTNYTCPT